MHPLEKKTLEILEHDTLVRPGQRLLVAVSAGPDSMALLHVLAALAGSLQLTLQAVYVNHGLRPAETAAEEALVRDRAGRLGIACEIGAVDVRTLAAQAKLSLEHAGRLLRYEFLEKTAEQLKAARIALAHTADDQAEEVLLRLVRGTGRCGLSGMRTLRDNRFIRPFLKFPKAELLAYLARYDIPFAEDSSNLEQDFLRNRVRLSLLPFLAEHFNPNISQTLIRTADILQEEEDLLADLTRTAAAAVFVAPEPAGRPDDGQKNKSLAMDLKGFFSQHRAIQRRLLETACLQMGCEPGTAQINQLIGLAGSPDREGMLHLAAGLRIRKSDGLLHFSYPKGKTNQRGDLAEDRDIPFALAIPEPGTYQVPELARRLIVEILDLPPQLPTAAADPNDYLDLGTVSFPLTLRSVRPGDRFQPLGAPGSKKVGDFLTDLKMARSARNPVAVLVSADRIAALPGLRIDHQHRITEATVKTLAIRLEKTR